MSSRSRPVARATTEETKSQIKAAAQMLFARRGVDGVTVQEIVNAAGQRNNAARLYPLHLEPAGFRPSGLARCTHQSLEFGLRRLLRIPEEDAPAACSYCRATAFHLHDLRQCNPVRTRGCAGEAPCEGQPALGSIVRHREHARHFGSSTHMFAVRADAGQTAGNKPGACALECCRQLRRRTFQIPGDPCICHSNPERLIRGGNANRPKATIPNATATKFHVTSAFSQTTRRPPSTAMAALTSPARTDAPIRPVPCPTQ